MNIIEKTKNWFRGLPDKKRYIELLTALLTIPVLTTVIISNVRSLQKSKEAAQVANEASGPQVTVIPVQIPVTTSPQEGATTGAGLTATPRQCIKTVGPVEISSPEEGETVSEDPICIDVSYNQGDYCSVVWSYRINNSPWSEYTDKSICIYSLSAGVKNLELKVKSIASKDEIILKKTFTVAGAISPGQDATTSAQ